MTPQQMAVLTSVLPQGQRYVATQMVLQAEQDGWKNVRFFDRMEIDGHSPHDLIGTHPGTGETEFLCDFRLE